MNRVTPHDGSKVHLCLLILIGAFALLMGGAFQSAQAATLCVKHSGGSGCYHTISAAETAAAAGDTIEVAPGTYPEYVKVTQSVYLVGAGPYFTIIDATHQPNAIYVNGATGVVVTGFTLENADFEGVLVHQSSSVNIWGNRVLDNNKSLVPGVAATCPGIATIYPFENGEDADCGEGVHLIATDHSSVSRNTIASNAGGVLLTDEDGATHDNSIVDNTVQNNFYDCGITLASHAPFGVFNNTIAGNEVERNGIYPPSGAGIGLFSPGGPTQNYGNVVVNNDLVENGLAGVALHTHAPGAEVLKDELVIGNHFSRNGPDTGLSPSAKPNGIALLVIGGTVSGLVFSQNDFDGEAVDIAALILPPTVSVTAQLNRFDSNTIGVQNYAAGTMDATENWWGCPQGPAAHHGCSTISGGGVFFAPWLTTPLFDDGRH
jgi:nitrous oxidase accessory protein NosD